jgi:hypothetical protein
MAKRETLTAAQVAAALTETSGLAYLAAEKLKVSARTVYNYAEKYPLVKEALNHQKGKRLDVTEGKLWQAVLDGEAWAICFYLKTQGKDRGYIERMVHAGDPASPIKAQHEHTGDVSLTVTAADVEAARMVLGAAGGDVHRNGRSQPVDT